MEKIGIDYDETLFELLEQICIYKNKKDNEKWNKYMFNSYNWENTWGGTHDQSVDLFFEFCEKNQHNKLKPVMYSTNFLNLLNEKYKLNVITVRSDCFKNITKSLANKYFGNIFEDFYFVGKHNTNSKYNSKLEACLDLGITTLIDDNIEYCKDCINSEIEILLLDKPWNQTFNDTKFENITRVTGWEEIYQILK